ncbi:hypothetical protein Tco_0312259 [Tanacetum coccineum]
MNGGNEDISGIAGEAKEINEVLHREASGISFSSICVRDDEDGVFWERIDTGGANDEGSSPSTKSVSNEAPVIDAERLTAVHPQRLLERESKLLNLLGKNLHKKLEKFCPKQLKLLVMPLILWMPIVILTFMFPSAKELKDSVDYHWVVAYVTPPPWKQHLKEISLEKLCDIHDKAYMRQAILENMLNSKTRKLKSTMSKARASCDAIRERVVAKDKAYIKLERKCNEALQDLDKNHLVLDMRYEIETLQRQVDRLHGEYSRLVLEEKKWVNYEQTLSILRSKVEGLENERERLKSSKTQLLHEIDRLRQDRAVVVSKVVPHVATKLVRSDEMGLLVARLVKAAMFYGRCTSFEEVAVLKKPFDLEKMYGYRSSSKKEFDQAISEVRT